MLQVNKENSKSKNGVISDAISDVNRNALDEKEVIVLDKLEENQYLSAKDLSDLLKLPFRSVQRYISNLKEKGFIERVGSNKTGYLKVIK